MTQAETLRTERAGLISKMRELNDKAEKEKRDLNTEEKASYEKLRADVSSLKERYERLESQETLERDLNAPQDRSRVPDPLQNRGNQPNEPAQSRNNGFDPTKVRLTRKYDSPDLENKVRRLVSGHLRAAGKRSTPEYSEAFDHYLRTNDPSKLRALEAGTAGEGGYTVPTDTASEVIETMVGESFMRQICQVRQTAKDTDIPVSGGVAGSWADEEADLFGALNEPTFTAFEAKAHKYKAAAKVSYELLTDSAADIAGLLARDFGRAYGRDSNSAYVNGAGPGSQQPTGVFAGSTDKLVVSATTFTATELRNHFFALPQQYRRNAVWVMNDLTLAFIAAMSADSNNEFLLNPSLREGQFDRILGRPVFTDGSVDMTGAANAELACLFDPQYYVIVDRINGNRFRRLEELFAANDQVGFLGTWRTDGKMTLADAGRTLKLASS
jgi:HK97 family phage major capsid protein